MKHYVYRLDDPITNEFYIGSRSCNCKIEDDGYTGSYKTWKPEDKSRLIKTVLKSDFKNRETTIKYESILIKEVIDNELNRNYHIPNKGFHATGLKHSDKTKLKISKASSGRIPWHAGTYGVFSEIHIEKLRNAKLGTIHSDVVKKKISVGNSGKVLSISTRKKISESRKLTGVALGENNPMHGKCHSAKTRKKMSENHADFKGCNSAKAKKCIDLHTNIVYDTLTELAMDMKIPISTMGRYVCDIRNKRYNYI